MFSGIILVFFFNGQFDLLVLNLRERAVSVEEGRTFTPKPPQCGRTNVMSTNAHTVGCVLRDADHMGRECFCFTSFFNDEV